MRAVRDLDVYLDSFLVGGYSPKRTKWENLKAHIHGWAMRTTLQEGKAVLQDILHTMEQLEEVEIKERESDRRR